MPVAYEALLRNMSGGILRCRVRAKHAKAFEEYATPRLSLGSHVFGKREERVAIAHAPLATEV